MEILPNLGGSDPVDLATVPATVGLTEKTNLDQHYVIILVTFDSVPYYQPVQVMKMWR